MADKPLNQPIPKEVKEIFNKAAKFRYELIKEAGWCVTCYRSKAVDGTRCPVCAEKYQHAAEVRARESGCQPWESGKRGRPPKIK